MTAATTCPAVGAGHAERVLLMRPVTWLDIARINATRWALLGAGFGVAATAVCWVRERSR